MGPYFVNLQNKPMTIKFFDVYSSPIVRSFFSSYVDHSCAFNLVDKIEFETLVTKLATDYSRDSRQVSYSTVISGHSVVFTFTLEEDTAFVSFDIDYSFTRKDLSKHVKFKIIKWLLAVWSIEKHNFNKYVCSPCCEGNTDSSINWRGAYYSKFGFTWIDDKTMILVK